MRLYYVFIASLIVLTFSAFSIAPERSAAQNTNGIRQQIEQVQREREALLEEQRRLQAELEAVNREAQTIGNAVKSLDATRRKLAADINVTQSRISSTNLTIQSLEANMTDKERKIEAHKKAIANALAVLSEYDSQPLLLSLLASANISDIWGDRSQLEGLSEKLEGEINELRETRKVLGQEKEEKEKVIEAQTSLQKQLAGQRSVVEENKKAQEKLLAETKSVEAEYQKMLADNLARQKQFEEDLFRLESELRITLDPSLIPSARPGILGWPLDNVYITQRFGRTSASGRLYASGTHNGVDFRAAQGTRVLAMLGGVIEGQGNTDEMNAQLRREGKPICGSYGRWILIKHPNGISSVYAHLSASIVQTGQTVAAGEVIGYSGGMPGVNGSGYSTGPHLHVGLFASQGVEIRQFTTSNNCKHTIVPIADVKAYLDPLAYLPAI